MTSSACTPAPFDLDRFLAGSNVATRHRCAWLVAARYEVDSAFGRAFLGRPPRLAGPDVRLNLGAGSHPSKQADWVNADFFPSVVNPNPLLVLRNLWALCRRDRRPDWMLDMRYPLDCPDNTWAGVFTSHTIEHLYYDQAFRLLREVRRTLRPGAWARFVLPDLAKYVRHYLHASPLPAFAKYPYGGAQAMHNLTQNWRHVSVWDYELLAEALRATGFEQISRVAYRTGSDARLFLDLEVRDGESFYAEARKGGAG